MDLQTQTIAKINALPPDLLFEVNDFVDFLYQKHQILFTGNDEKLTEGEMTDYLANLTDYETSLAEGKIKW